MSSKVLIAIDCAKRELFGCTLLARYLNSMGIEAILCGTHAFRPYYQRYLPEVVVFPNVMWDLSDIAEQSVVCILPSESGNGEPDQMASWHGGTSKVPLYTGTVDRFFCWGPAMKEVLLKTGLWRDEQLVVTGSPSTDHWLLAGSEDKSSAFQVGLSTSFKALSNSQPPSKTNYFQWLDEVEINGGDGSYFCPPAHAESWLFFEASLARALATLVRVLSAEHSIKLTIRPHPYEHECRYAYFRSLTNGRAVVTKEGTISEWLGHVSLVFTAMSASALDAYIRGVPAVSIKKLLDPDALRKLPKHFHYRYEEWLWQMDDLGQAIDYVEAAKKGQLALCRDEKSMREFLIQNFSFPRSCPAAMQVAAEIKKVLDDAGPRRVEKRLQARRSRRKLIHDTVCHYVPLSVQCIAFGLYLRSLLPGQVSQELFYHPWRMRERRAATRCAKQVLHAVVKHSV